MQIYVLLILNSEMNIKYRLLVEGRDVSCFRALTSLGL